MLVADLPVNAGYMDILHMSSYTYFYYGLAICIVIGVPITSALWMRRKLHAPWKYLAYGILTFIISQVLRLPTLEIIRKVTGAQHESATILWLACLALSAGFFEEVARYIGFLFLFRGGRNPKNAVMYGLGHGGFETSLVALQMLSVLRMLSAYGRLDISAVHLNAQTLAIIEFAKTGWLPMAGAFERIATLPVHVALSLVVLQAFSRQDRSWLVLAIGIHAGINFSAIFASRHLGLFWTEILLGLFAIGAILLVQKLIND